MQWPFIEILWPLVLLLHATLVDLQKATLSLSAAHMLLYDGVIFNSDSFVHVYSYSMHCCCWLCQIRWHCILLHKVVFGHFLYNNNGITVNLWSCISVWLSGEMRRFYYCAPVGEWSICLSVSMHILKTTSKFSVPNFLALGLVFLWQQCNMLCRFQFCGWCHVFI